MSKVNILKQVKASDGRWRMVAIPKNAKGGFDWNALPDGRYYIEFYERGRRRRKAAGGTVAEAQEAVRRKKHTLEAQALGLETEEEVQRKTVLHVAVKHYLGHVLAQRKPNTHRKYECFAPAGSGRSVQPLR